MSAAVITPQLRGVAMCMEHWASAQEEALDQAHNRRLTSSQRVEAFRFASRAEVRACRLAELLRTSVTDRFMQVAA